MIQRATSLFAIWTVLGTAWAFILPEHWLWVGDGSVAPFGQPLISVLLGVIMLGMGLTLSVEDFRRVLAMPRAVAAGVVLQFTIMPLAGVTLAAVFGLETGLAVGLILVACCPGGTASNVVTYLARANVALSVCMTMASTLVAIVLTPLLTGWLAGYYIEIDRWNLFREMIVIVLLPVVAGIALNSVLPKAALRVSEFSPLISVAGVVVIVAGIIAKSRDLIIENAGILLAAVISLHLLGFALGYGVTRLLRFAPPEARTISIEVGMQNSGLGASMASTKAFAAQFANPMQAAFAPVPAAISAVCHVVIGSLLASVWGRAADAPHPQTTAA
ncbi:MAG: bile acid:sodium symporter family protein [Novosphingobium sp.]|nr:bile acid:sodium symporter family protein [Novosphingobium sp.]